MPSFSKHKRNTRDMRCVLFPEDVRETFVRRGTCETPKAAKSSWERCGDSFLDTPVMEKRVTVRQTSRAVHQLAQTSTSGHEDPVHIAWTSSEEEQSDGERQLSITKAARRSRPEVSASGRYGHFLSTGAETDELPTIDSESEHEDNSTSNEQISLVAAEISDYSSDSDGDPDPSRLDSPAGEQQKSISEWLRSAQALLQTPPKQTEKPSKTPEDSGKKKRKFESRGLAERLNRLQSRQKSAISFWRHQPVSSITTGTEHRPGVLVLHVQKVWEVCGMQAALCQRRPESETCVALFSRETAAQLAPSADDTIHVYPPWEWPTFLFLAALCSFPASQREKHSWILFLPFPPLGLSLSLSFFLSVLVSRRSGPQHLLLMGTRKQIANMCRTGRYWTSGPGRKSKSLTSPLT